MTRSRHILIVDDDCEIRDLVGKVLEREGFRISLVENGKAMRRALASSAVDLIVLDIMMPGDDGLALCLELRGALDQTPIIMLTAKGDEIDRVVGLEMGADDYLAKPFHSRELIARIKAVLRRTDQSPRSEIVAGVRFLGFRGWRLDMGNRELLSPDGVVVSLSSGEYDLLVALAKRPNCTLTRDMLLDLTRGRASIVFDRSIDVQISRLRRKLGDDPKNPSIIKTVWGGGYLFAADVLES